jgi:hypothetical protein
LADFNWSSLQREDLCEQKLVILQNVLETGLDIFHPSETVKLGYMTKTNPGGTPKFKKTILNRQNAYHDGKAKQYRHFRELSNQQCAKLRCTYLQKMMDQLKSNADPYRWWECIK